MPSHRGETAIKLSQDVAEAGETGAEMPLYSRINGYNCDAKNYHLIRV